MTATTAETQAMDSVMEKGALLPCPEEGCGRAFMDKGGLLEHAEAVHTFDDVRLMLSDVVREKYGRRGDYEATPSVAGVWVWIQDLAEDWVVFEVESQGDCTLYKASYAIADDLVTLGEPTEVVRRTVYTAVSNGKTDGTP
jgi:hypothetical protein